MRNHPGPSLPKPRQGNIQKVVEAVAEDVVNVIYFLIPSKNFGFT
jgi:hypothetical protein